MSINKTIEIWPVERLVPYKRNPRKNDAAVTRMMASLTEFGFKIPMLVRSDGEIVDGHLRLKAALKLGMTEVPIIRCDEWSAAQVKAFRLMVNRSATWAEWDEGLLAIEFGELAELNFEPTLTGFDPREIDMFMGACDAGDDAQLDSVAELPENPVSRTGDLWLCGKHRVLCGDCTSPDSVSANRS
jgi:ParB-like chromosome segregation protein Spo0J